MTLAQLQATLSQIEDLRKALTLSQQAVPFVEEVLKEVSPLLDEIHRSIEESTSNFPRAATQIQNVSQATELATTEIMDILDAMTARLDEVRSLLEQQNCCQQTATDSNEKLSMLLRERLAGDKNLLAEVELILEGERLARTSSAALHASILEGLDRMRRKAGRIMLALQVQDIASQQLASVNYMMESIRLRLSLLVRRINSGVSDEAFRPDDRPHAFDPQASFDGSGSRQSLADSVVSRYHSGCDVPRLAASQDEIDALFNDCESGGGRPPDDQERAHTTNPPAIPGAIL